LGVGKNDRPRRGSAFRQLVRNVLRRPDFGVKINVGHAQTLSECVRFEAIPCY
jgi:hypothetical protein